MTNTCATPGCERVRRHDSPWCADCFVRHLYGRPGASVAVKRMGTRPLPEITELEMRLLYGDK